MEEKKEETVTEKEETETKPKSPRVKKIKQSSADTITKLKNPGRVEAGKNLALWNKTQKERLLQGSSKEQQEQKEQQQQQQAFCGTKQCCVSNASNAYKMHTMHMLGFAAGVSIVGYICYKKYKSAKPSTVCSTAQSKPQEKIKSTPEELIKKRK